MENSGGRYSWYPTTEAIIGLLEHSTEGSARLPQTNPNTNKFCGPKEVLSRGTEVKLDQSIPPVVYKAIQQNGPFEP